MIADIFSKRQQKLRGETPDVYQYAEMPRPLRIQVVQILNEALPPGEESSRNGGGFEAIRDILRREYGVHALYEDRNSIRNRSARYEVSGFMQTEPNPEHVLDAVELAARIVLRTPEYRRSRMARPAKDVVDELNHRMKESGFGFQIVGSDVIRVDSEFIHKEVVLAALHLLADKAFAGANDEFLRAHEHYRHGRLEECLVDCLKAFESAMKVICKKRGWAYADNDTAKKLVDTCFANNLVPSDLQSELSGLRALLESGIPTIRNRNAGHGQGVTVREVPEHLVRYCLNQTAATLLFLIECDQALG
jgi:hypothetical protein